MSLANVLRFDTPLARLRATTFLEGCSFVLLLGVAMTLNYAADMPLDRELRADDEAWRRRRG